MVELRKRKEAPTAPPPLTKRNSGTVKKVVDKAKAVLKGAPTTTTAEPEIAAPAAPAAPAAAPTTTSNGTNGAAPKTGKIAVGDTIDLDGFGGEVETHTGEKTTLKKLVDASGAGVVIFTYPKASTPGCTTQACLFRDSYLPITGASLAVYGLSTDSTKSNTTFATKQKLPFPLLCDPAATLTAALGLKKPGPGKSTTRGVVVIDKQSQIRVWEAAGPQKTLDLVLDYVRNEGMTETGAPAAVAAPPADDPKATEEAAKLADPDVKMDEYPLIKESSKEEVEAADTAAEVSETAKKLDG